jgi:hypothetical protein
MNQGSQFSEVRPAFWQLNREGQLYGFIIHYSFAEKLHFLS